MPDDVNEDALAGALKRAADAGARQIMPLSAAGITVLAVRRRRRKLAVTASAIACLLIGTGTMLAAGLDPDAPSAPTGPTVGPVRSSFSLPPPPSPPLPSRLASPAPFEASSSSTSAATTPPSTSSETALATAPNDR